MMDAHYSSHEYQGDYRSWAEVLYDVYKPQASSALDPQHMTGRIRQWQFGAVEVSDYECGAMRFRRESRHVGPGCEDHYFISMPYLANCAMDLSQENRTAHCTPGNMIVQHTGRPSELVHSRVGALIVRVQGPSLRTRFRNATSCLGLVLPCMGSAGALFSSLARSLVANVTSLGSDVKGAAGEKLVDLLAIALEAEAGDLPRRGCAVRLGHHARAMRYIREHYRDRDMTPASVAAACGISIGYLHEIFRDNAHTVQEAIFETRLLAARRILDDSIGSPKSVSEIAYFCGFSDAAHFSRRFSRRFGAPPRAFLGTGTGRGDTEA